MKTLISINPANGEKVGESVMSTPEDIQRAVEKAHSAHDMVKRHNALIN